MPEIPRPYVSPEHMPWVRWAQQAIIDLMRDSARREQAEGNLNSSQTSTMNTLVERLGQVEAIMQTIGSSLTISASQVTSGVFDDARIPELNASKIDSGTLTRPVATSGSVSAGGNVSSGGTVSAAGNGTFNGAWNYDVSAITRRAVWMDSNGTMGHTSSSEIYKKNIEDFVPNETAVRLLRLVSFNWDPYYTKYWRHTEVGLIAQQLHNLGLRWLVDYEDDGVTPHSIHYDRLALAILPLTQRLADDVDALNAQVGDLNAKLEAMEARLAALEESE